jgi:hypothetical protein
MFVSNSLLFFIPEEASKEKKGKAVRVFFRKLCKAVKRPIVCCGPDRVLRLSAQMDAHLDDPKVTPVPGPTAAAPELPGQVCDDPEPLSCVPRSSGIIEQTQDPETLVPDSSALNLCHSESLSLSFLLFLSCSILLRIIGQWLFTPSTSNN